MASTDPELGERVHKHLLDLGIETPMKATAESASEKLTPKNRMEFHMREVLLSLGMDLTDDSLVKTPHRIAKMFAHEIFYGLDYNNFPASMAMENKMKVNEVVCVKNILVRSVCEHHFQPFIGVAHVGYIPDKKVVGLSKLNRIVDFFCRRPQVQERLNEQIAAALSLVLETKDVAVVIDAEHFCVKLRGVQDPHSSTATSKMMGKFMEVPQLRAEFFSLIRGAAK